MFKRHGETLSFGSGNAQIRKGYSRKRGGGCRKYCDALVALLALVALSSTQDRVITWHSDAIVVAPVLIQLFNMAAHSGDQILVAQFVSTRNALRVYLLEHIDSNILCRTRAANHRNFV